VTPAAVAGGQSKALFNKVGFYITEIAPISIINYQLPYKQDKQEARELLFQSSKSKEVAHLARLVRFAPLPHPHPLLRTLRMSYFTDIGANLLDPMFSGVYNSKQKHEPDLDHVLFRAATTGVHRIILTGTCRKSSTSAMQLAREWNAKRGEGSCKLFCTVGLHPTQASEALGDPEAYEASLLALAREGSRDGTCVAVGECGLDFDRLHFAPKDHQRLAFPMHLRIAQKTGLPLFLHDRNTGGDLLRLISEFGGMPQGGGVVHSFTGTKEELGDVLDIAGLYVGINGCSVKTAQNCETAALLPLTRLLLETDAPWCGIRGSSAARPHVVTEWAEKKPEHTCAGAVDVMVKGRNEPCCVLQVAEVLAALKSVTLEEVRDAAEGNAERLFFRGRSGEGEK
jgi:TatD DNase family protein